MRRQHHSHTLLLLAMALTACLWQNISAFTTTSRPSLRQLPPTTTTQNKNILLEQASVGEDASHMPMTVAETSAKAVELPLIQLALAGAVTTFFTDVSMHPIDCVKTLQQTDAGLDSTFVETAQSIYQHMGIAGFYSGFLIYASADAVGGALKFSTWELWKKTTNHMKQLPPWMILWIGAGLAFVASSILVVPGELLKNQLQVGIFPGLDEAITTTFESLGPGGFYVGYEGVLYRDIPYTMLELGLYEIFKRFLADTRSTKLQLEPFWQEIVAAAATGGITAFVTTPIDVIKTKLMVDHYDSFFEGFSMTVANHGVPALFAGVFARISWIVPFTAIYLPTYDFIKRQMLIRHVAFLQERESIVTKDR